ncbi:acyltransferase [Pelagicoccus albus]|uniref:Acyltransferase n=1 Tax=Pelagicoccus albus TaxID=415222 RepID=A0A7X1B9M7_9BACT|nr:acyltransferase [Pelagicoccus albus]MBC2608246.1 acyltransferase [Pelagicoccus albus]
MLLKILKLCKRIRNSAFTALCSSSFHSFGKRSKIELPFRSENEFAISIGKNVYVGSDSWFSAIPKKGSHKPAITIGDSCSLSGHCTITAVEKVEIQSGVLIARYAYISDHSHAYDLSDDPIKDQGTTKPQPVVIESGAWLGQGVVICPGVRIGRNSIIAANSVVKCDVPPFSVAAGSPARIVRENFPVKSRKDVSNTPNNS